MKIYANKPSATVEFKVEPWDMGDDGTAVWRVSMEGRDYVFVEGSVDDDVVTIIDRAVRAYDE